MKSIFCILNKHNYQPKIAFITNILGKDGTHIRKEESVTGYQCTRCQAKKIKKNEDALDSPDANQEGYDWLFSAPEPENPTMLTVVQK